jgi:hypothetical protein
MALLRALFKLFKHLIKYFDDILKHLDDFPIVQLLIEGIKENREAILLVLLSGFLIWIFYKTNKAKTPTK